MLSAELRNFSESSEQSTNSERKAHELVAMNLFIPHKQKSQGTSHTDEIRKLYVHPLYVRRMKQEI